MVAWLVAEATEGLAVAAARLTVEVVAVDEVIAVDVARLAEAGDVGVVAGEAEADRASVASAGVPPSGSSAAHEA